MNFEPVEQIAEAALYEGYMLYPYRPSSVKNRQRFNFGVLCPSAYCDLNRGSDSNFMQTECLFEAAPQTRLTIKVRFLQIVQRSVARYAGPGSLTAAGELEFVDRLEVDGTIYEPWQEAIDRSVTYDALDPVGLLASHLMPFTIPAESWREELLTEGRPAGVVIRQSQSLAGALHIRTQRCPDGVMKLTVRLENRTPFDAATAETDREAALPFSLVSAHMILGLEDGEFLSLLDPPAACADLARGCANFGNWPVLVGDGPTAMLASPIILYDYPQIAPESAGNLFDGTEIDEILSLRILTLTDLEKAEIRRSDHRARELLDRTETIPNEQFLKLHGVLRGLKALKEGPA